MTFPTAVPSLPKFALGASAQSTIKALMWVFLASPVVVSATPALLSPAPVAVPQEVNASSAPVVLRRVLAPALYELAYSSKQNALFVVSAGGTEENASLTRVMRLDPKTLDLQTEIPLPQQGFGVALDDDKHRLYVSHALDGMVSVIDTRSNQVTHRIQLSEKVKMVGFQGEDVERPPHNLRELVLDKVNQRLFAPGLWIKDSAVYVVDLKTMKLEKVLTGFGFGAAGVTQDARSGKVFVSNLQGQLFRINSQTLEVEHTFEVAADQLLNLSYDSLRGRVLAVDQGAPHIDVVREKEGHLSYKNRGQGNQVVVLDPEQGRVEKQLSTGRGPVSLLVDEPRRRLYVTNRGDANVMVFDLDAAHLLHTIDLPVHPNSLSLDPESGAVFVTIKQQHQKRVRQAESVARIDLPK